MCEREELERDLEEIKLARDVYMHMLTPPDQVGV